MPGHCLERFARKTRASLLTPPAESELCLALRTRGDRGTGRGPNHAEPQRCSRDWDSRLPCCALLSPSPSRAAVPADH